MVLGLAIPDLIGLLLKYGPGVVDTVSGWIAAGKTHVTPEEWATLKAKIATKGEDLIPERPV